MNIEDMRVKVRWEDTFNGVGIWIMGRKNDGVYFAKPMQLEFTKAEGYPMLSEPTLSFTNEGQGKVFLTDMSNELARLGFMPDKIKALDGELKATQAHLADMRKIAMGLILPPAFYDGSEK